MCGALHFKNQRFLIVKKDEVTLSPPPLASACPLYREHARSIGGSYVPLLRSITAP